MSARCETGECEANGRCAFCRAAAGEVCRATVAFEDDISTAPNGRIKIGFKQTLKPPEIMLDDDQTPCVCCGRFVRNFWEPRGAYPANVCWSCQHDGFRGTGLYPFGGYGPDFEHLGALGALVKTLARECKNGGR